MTNCQASDGGDKRSRGREGRGPEQPRSTAWPRGHRSGEAWKDTERSVCVGGGCLKAGGWEARVQVTEKIPVLTWGNGRCSINISENLKEGFKKTQLIKILREIVWSNVICVWVIQMKLNLANYFRSTVGETRMWGRQALQNHPEETWKIIHTRKAAAITLISINASIFKKRRKKDEKATTKEVL